ncbi:SAG family member [Eimeria brunetti]|uniref:SAG family member n=1 Tax=Eimeria brunetti TaxID=51314 RepID=U6L652_9EIME|nr:SAG family member [Eimeria brunetti]
MAPLYKTAAAVCLVALHGLQVQAAQTTIKYKFKPVVTDDAAYFAVNLVRNGKLPVRISEVAKENNLVSTLTEKVQSKEKEKTFSGEPEEAVTIDETCSELVEPNGLKDIFHYTFEYEEGVSQKSPNYRELLQAALDEGLKVFTDSQNQNQWETIWQDDDGANLAYLLGANSTAIGCVIGQCTTEKSTTPGGRSTATPTGKAVLFCELKPAAEKSKAPFDEEYYDGLIARTDKLASMTEEDLKAPSNDATATAAIPTILSAGVVAMLTVASA